MEEQNPSLPPPRSPRFPSSPFPRLPTCARRSTCGDTAEGVLVSTGLTKGGLDGSLVVGAVVAPAQAHAVLLRPHQVRRLVGHGDGHGGRGGARGAGRGGEQGRGFHAVVELRQREFDFGELAVCRLGGLVHPRRHDGVLVLLTRYLGNSRASMKQQEQV